MDRCETNGVLCVIMLRTNVSTSIVSSIVSNTSLNISARGSSSIVVVVGSGRSGVVTGVVVGGGITILVGGHVRLSLSILLGFVDWMLEWLTELSNSETETGRWNIPVTSDQSNTEYLVIVRNDLVKM